MAIAQQYPLNTPKNSDLLVGTSIPDPNTNDNPKTSNFSVSSIGSFLIAENNIITGSGTLNTIPIFTPDGQTIGDSIMLQKSNGIEIQVGTGGGAQQTTLGATYISAGSVGADVVTAININGGNTGNVILSGGVIIGNEATDILQITSAVSDYTGSSSTSAGQVLASTATGQLSWSSINAISEIKSEKITVSTAELRNLHTTPKILIDVTAGNPKEICQVYSVIFGVGGNNALNKLTFPNDLNIEADVASPWKYVIPQSVANDQPVLDPYYNPSLTAGRIGLDSDVILSSAGAAVETGTATTTMTVWITYRIFNIAD